MLHPPGSSAALRFLKRSGFALLTALGVTLILGGLSWARVPQGDEDATDSSFAPARLLERLELWTYDWRLRELGRRSEPSRDVVLVAVDDETLARASASRQPGLAQQPWPREVMGGLVNELSRQGARQVLVDFPFSYLSPTWCPSPSTREQDLGGPELKDDLRFRALLDEFPGTSVLAFNRQFQERSFLASELVQQLALVDQLDGREATVEPLRKLLSTRRMAFSIPDGTRFQVWAGVESKEDAIQLLSSMSATRVPEPVMRARTSGEGSYQVTPTDLLVSLASVEVEGIDPLKLPVIPAIDHPAAPLLGGKSGFGSVIAPADVDGIVRRFPHLLAFQSRGKTHVLPSMPLVAAMRVAGSHRLVWRNGVLKVGDRFSFPMDERGYSLLRWDAGESDGARGSLGTALSAWRILQDVSARREGLPVRQPAAIKDRVVVLADASSAGRDFRSTPIGDQMSGGALLGQALANILHSQGIHRVTPKWDVLAVGALSLFGALSALALSGALRSRRGPLIQLTVWMAGLGAWALVARHFFVEQSQWVAMAAPALGMSCAFLITGMHGTKSERRVRDFIVSVLGKSVSPEVAKRVARDFSLIRPERREVTVCVVDIEGFSRISNTLPPEDLIRLLEEFFAETTLPVRQTGGHLDKLVGDAAMALWNAPTRNPKHASLACESALRMRASLVTRQSDWEKRFGVRVVARIGVETGEAVVGHVGSDIQAEYTAVGEPVSLAFRWERANQSWGTFILVGETTFERARDEFVFREVDLVRTRQGDSRPLIRIFELLARKNERDPRLSLLEEYEAAMALYRARRFEEAGQRFAHLATGFDDPVSAVYVGRCRQYATVPPPEEWDGVFDRRAA